MFLEISNEKTKTVYNCIEHLTILKTAAFSDQLGH